MKPVFLALVLVGCAKPATEPAPDPEPSCVSRLVGLTPADGTTDVRTDAVVEVQLSAPPDPGWSVGITGVSGITTLAPNGLTAIFAPDEPFLHEFTYTARVEVCGAVTESTFQTVEEPVSVAPGDAWELPFGELVWHEPASAAALTAFVEFDSFLMEVVEVAPDGASFDAAFTAAWPGGQPECPSAVGISADFSENPVFSTEASLMEIPVVGAIVPLTIHIDGLTLVGRVTADGELLDVRFTGRIDTRDFDALLGLPGATCVLAANAGDTCIPCADGAVSCLDLDVEAGSTEPTIGPGIVVPCGL